MTNDQFNALVKLILDLDDIKNVARTSGPSFPYKESRYQRWETEAIEEARYIIVEEN
jgi:hypothetical protein